MELMADRFVRLDSSFGLDLASGRLVCWRGLPPAGGAVAESWLERCELASRLRHPNLARLVDFGVWGAGRRFEAYDVGGRCAIGRRGSAAAFRDVRIFLASCGLRMTSATARPRFAECAGEPVWIPESALTLAPNPLPGPEPRHGTLRTRRRKIGVLLVSRAALTDAVAVLDEAGRYASGPEWIVVRGPHGSGRTTVLGQLAREARIRGYVPVRASLLADERRPGCPLTPADLRTLLAGRHLCVIADEEAPDGSRVPDVLARALPLAGRLGARAHVALIAGLDGLDDRPAIDLEPLAVEDLVRMVRLGVRTGRGTGRAMALAAARSEGLPGVFLGLLQRSLAGRVRAERWNTGAAVAAVAEDAEEYRVDGGRRLPCGPADGREPGDVAIVRGAIARMGAAGEERAARLMARGRHAAAQRVLRSALAAAVRRDDSVGAALAALGLGRTLLIRGRAGDAALTFDAAREHFNRAGLAAGCIVAGVWTGLACTDEGRLLEAETTLKMSALAADHLGDPRAGIRAWLAFARCLFWQGRYDEARVALERIPPGGDAAAPPDRLPAGLWAGPDPLVIRDALAARIAVGEGQLAQAGRRARSAVERAAALGEPSAVALAQIARALVCARMGELEGLAASVRAGLDAARQAHAPLLAARLRLLLVLGLLEAGKRREAGRLVRQLHRLAAWPALPRLLRARILQTCAEGQGRDASAAVQASRTRPVDRFARDSGALALQLFTALPPSSRAPEGDEAGPLPVRHVVSLLQLCHESGDERTTLSRVAAFLRERLRAAGVTFCARDGGRLSVVAWAGSRTDRLDTVQRAVDLDEATRPSPCRGGIERAVPIRLGGTCVGAIVCRWTAGADVDQEAAGALLAATAAATALSVRLLGDALHPGEGGEGDRGLIGESHVMTELRRAIARAARAPFGVLIEGESGSGKELVARAIHQLGPRRERRFCSLNCAAIPDELLEAELFGHARGAFTGAATDRPGLFEEADGGTLFMDEVGELSLRAQAKLLRVLQEGEIRRLGETGGRRIDVRVVAATNRSLRDEAAAGRFRHDLLYRLDVVRIVVPPLRDRIDDVPLLATHFWRRAAARTGSRAVLAPATLAALARHDWPGNVRELQNVLSTLAVAGPQRGSVPPDALPIGLSAPGERPGTLEEARRACEARVVRAALARAGGHRGRAAAELGLTRQGLTKLLVRLGIAVEPQDRGGGTTAGLADLR
ncbi:MAG TPA: sigma 54-interacting transcriptional regulator [Vicinamibacterales bacterium]|nr:sigma 54-interacting transcriptional regulator [Vicinamibacterales bacterium]